MKPKIGLYKITHYTNWHYTKDYKHVIDSPSFVELDHNKEEGGDIGYFITHTQLETILEALEQSLSSSYGHNESIVFDSVEKAIRIIEEGK